jgi:hypothetical protein
MIKMKYAAELEWYIYCTKVFQDFPYLFLHLYYQEQH